MSDDSQYIKTIQDFVLALLNSHVSEKEKTEFQIKSLLRFSLLERILSKFLFRYRSKNYDLLNLLLYFKEHTESEGGSDGIFESLKTMFEEVHKELLKTDSLFFYGKLMQEILKFPKKLQENQKDYKDFSQEDAEEKIEPLLKDHIEANLFPPSDSSQKIDDQYFNDNYVKQLSGKLNFEYSVCSLKTMFKILERFEQQSLIIKDPELLITSEEGMICEKKLFCYLDKMNKEIKFTPKNLIDYFIQSHITRISQELYRQDSVVNNYEIENNICFSLFLLKKIIKDYSFYFDKKPELERIFNSVKKFKDWPLPIGTFGMQLYEVLINEMYYQGVSILNDLRKTYFLDIIDPNLTSIETKYFNSVTFIYCTEDEKHKELNSGVDDNNRQDLHRILQNFTSRKKRYEQISFREFMVKIFLTTVRNSNERINYSILDNIIKKFMTPKKNENYNDFNNNNNNNNLNQGVGEENLEVDENEKGDDNNFTNTNNKKKTIEDNTRPCIETLLKIIDVGLDKSYDDFMQDINLLAHNIVKITENFNMMANIEVKNNPITEYRNYLKPQYYEKKKISITEDRTDKISLMNKSDYLNIYEHYKALFTGTFFTYFSHLLDNTNNILIDSERIQMLEKRRFNFYKDYRTKFVLVEDEKVFSSLIDYIFIFYNDQIHLDKFDQDFTYIWSKFIKNKEDFELNFVLYLVPQYNSYKEIYAANNVSKNDKGTEDYHPLLSEFISYTDHIYKSTVYLPWSVPRENDLGEYMTKMNENIGNGGGDFLGPTPNMLYSYLKQPLNLYVSEADHIFNLNLYKLTVEQGNFKFEKLFWKSIDIQLFNQKNIFEKRKKDKVTVFQCNMNMQCVDLLGVHYKDKDKERKETSVTLNDPINIKIFNVFFRKDAPYNYNMTSNNGWLEVFTFDNPIAESLPSTFNKVTNTSSKINYFEDFVIPQFELDCIYKNYKATCIDIYPPEPVTIKIDEAFELNQNHYRSGENYTEQLHIRIEKYERNGKHVSVPIATFMPIV